jgi:hypothetical protein
MTKWLIFWLANRCAPSQHEAYQTDNDTGHSTWTLRDKGRNRLPAPAGWVCDITIENASQQIVGR